MVPSAAGMDETTIPPATATTAVRATMTGRAAILFLNCCMFKDSFSCQGLGWRVLVTDGRKRAVGVSACVPGRDHIRRTRAGVSGFLVALAFAGRRAAGPASRPGGGTFRTR